MPSTAAPVELEMIPGAAFSFRLSARATFLGASAMKLASGDDAGFGGPLPTVWQQTGIDV